MRDSFPAEFRARCWRFSTFVRTWLQQPGGCQPSEIWTLYLLHDAVRWCAPPGFVAKSSAGLVALSQALAYPRLCEMEGGSLADLAGMMGLSSINITDSINKERERRSSNLSDSSEASVVSVSLSLDGGVVQVTLDTSAFGEA